MNAEIEARGAVLTPLENYEREKDLTCPYHGTKVLPAAVCPVCRFPEEYIHSTVGHMLELSYRRRSS